MGGVVEVSIYNIGPDNRALNAKLRNLDFILLVCGNLRQFFSKSMISMILCWED